MIEASRKVLEEKIGYRFKDRYLLECALTHTSFANEQKIQTFRDYERIEFLGDAVLEMISSDFLFRTYPEKKEGELTKLRASLVCEPALAYCARDLSLGSFIRLGKGEEASGGREKDSIISDVMEALIGALYLDSGGIEEPRRSRSAPSRKARRSVMRFWKRADRDTADCSGSLSYWTVRRPA